MQTRTQSLIESACNIAIGYCVAVAAQMVIFPLFDIHVAPSENFQIGAFFTVISLVRSYLVRRLFNKIHSTRKE